jgi:hypothetical protein
MYTLIENQKFIAPPNPGAPPLFPQFTTPQGIKSTCLMICFEVITRAIRIAKLNGWLWRPDDVTVLVAVHLVHNHP